MDALEYHSRPKLNRPVLVAAFRSNWLDTAEAASGAAQWLRQRWKLQRFASIDPEYFYDFTVVRPQARSVDGRRETVWPSLDFFAGRIPGTERDIIVFTGVEPSTRWRLFSESVLTVARDTGVEVLVTFGALGTNVPHTRPARLMGVAFDDEMAMRYGLQHSNYQGGTGISSVLAEAARTEAIDVLYLVAMIPNYVPTGPSPNGMIALVRGMGELVGFPVDVSPLERELTEYQKRVQRAVDADPEIARYVKMLERQIDEQTVDIPSADELAQQFEDYLRSQQGDE